MIHNSLFISSSKWVKKHYKKILQFLIMILLFVFMCNALNYIYVSEDAWSRIMWHNFYEEEENIDNLFVGSSHVYLDINPLKLDEMNGQNNFNLGFPEMRLNASYYAILEASKYNKLENVVLELFYGSAVGEAGEIFSEESIKRNWNVTDNMHMSIEKIALMMTMSNKDKYLDTVFPFIRYREHAFEFPYIMNTINNKRTNGYLSYAFKKEYEDGTIEFRDKGVYYTTLRIHADKGGLLINSKQIANSNQVITASAEKYLRKIIDFCKDNGINLTLMVSPMYELQVISTENYDAYYEQINGIAKEYNVPLYDFNLCKQEYLDIQYCENFMDVGHLNAKGADVFTPYLWDVVSNSYENNKEYFYNTFEEKLEAERPRVWGAYWIDGYDEEAAINDVSVASNRDTGMEYEIILIPEAGEERVVQNFSENKVFTIPNNEHGTMVITSKYDENPEDIQTLEMSY